MQCENPECKAEAMYMRSGSLYYIDLREIAGAVRGAERKRLIWLCGDCSQHYRVETWRPAGQQLQHDDAPAIRKSMLSFPASKIAAA